ncbi:MAG: hypothetical protein MUC88_12670 [Planctomycetes bacterium]|nr:hypothetical protein [Planctomycetota bacterium]
MGRVGSIAVCILLFVLPSWAAQKARKDGSRPAEVCLSNGEVFTGDVFLTPGRSFKLNVPKAGELKTTDMITGEDVQYGKVRTFTFDPVRDIQFDPEKEVMTRDWRFIETTKYDEKTAVADYTPAKKEFSGQPHPVRYLAATVTFESGETLQGHLYTATIYLKTKDKTLRWVLRSKDQGKEGQSLDDLVYVERVRMLDESKEMTAQVKLTLTGAKLGTKDAVQALTRQSLTPVPTKTTSENTCVVTSAFGEDLYLALRREGKYVVGWPEQKDPQLWTLAQDHVNRMRDFYNERQLLGAILGPDGREVLTLVNLRRRIAPTNFGEIGGEWDKEKGALVEPWRLSIWRWKYDSQTRELALTDRGTFFRLIFLPKDPTPTVELSESLWHMQRTGDTIVVGAK